MGLYQHGRRTARQKDKRVFLKTAFVFATALLVATWILHKDLATDSTEKSTVPIVTNVNAQGGDTIDIQEPLFTMQLPSDWKQINRVQNQRANYYEWQSSKQGANDRVLKLHIDVIPASYKVVRMLPLLPNGNQFMVGNVSGNCRNFAKDTGAGRDMQDTAPVEAKWEGVIFVCDPINANQTVGTGTVEDSIAARLGGHQFFFYYEDHNIRPDDQILINAVKSFRVR